MTQQTIDFQPAERLSLCDKLEAYLKARPNQWIDGKRFESVAGGYGWRTRLSECRRERGMTIENRQRKIPHHDSWCAGVRSWDEPGSGACNCTKPTRTLSEYMYVPEGQ
jgi:hypothetical protein